MGDPKATGRTKRFRDRMALMQNLLRAKEAHTRTGEALDNMLRLLIEEEAEDTPSSPPPKLLAPGDRPTRLYPAVGAEAFMRHVRELWAGARSEEHRQAVKDLIKRGVSTKIITEAESDSILEEIRRSP